MKSEMSNTVPQILKYLSTNNNFNVIDQNIDMPMRAKKRRLDHLSWEEKLQRKKLKNRVAAQTSRDRKKAKMEQMETALQELFAKNEAVLEECERLRKTNEKLQSENAELVKRLSEPCVGCAQNRSGVCESQSGSTESLLRPKGTVTHTAAALRNNPLVQMLLVYLLSRIYSTNSTQTSTCPPSNNLHSLFYKTSPETWRKLLKKQMHKNQIAKNSIVLGKWWGRHQNSWNPVEVR